MSKGKEERKCYHVQEMGTRMEKKFEKRLVVEMRKQSQEITKGS